MQARPLATKRLLVRNITDKRKTNLRAHHLWHHARIRKHNNQTVISNNHFIMPIESKPPTTSVLKHLRCMLIKWLNFNNYNLWHHDPPWWAQNLDDHYIHKFATSAHLSVGSTVRSVDQNMHIASSSQSALDFKQSFMADILMVEWCWHRIPRDQSLGPQDKVSL